MPLPSRYFCPRRHRSFVSIQPSCCARAERECTDLMGGEGWSREVHCSPSSSSSSHSFQGLVRVVELKCHCQRLRFSEHIQIRTLQYFSSSKTCTTRYPLHRREVSRHDRHFEGKDMFLTPEPQESRHRILGPFPKGHVEHDGRFVTGRLFITRRFTSLGRLPRPFSLIKILQDRLARLSFTFGKRGKPCGGGIFLPLSQKDSNLQLGCLSCRQRQSSEKSRT